MGGSAKSEEADTVASLNTGDPQAAKANDARAQERRSVQVVQLWRELKHKVAAGRGILRITAVDGVSREYRCIAKIFKSAAAIGAGSVDSANPGNTDARAERQLSVGTVFDNP